MSTGFLDLPPELCDPERSRIAVLPVPYDATSTWMKGADRGPQAIIDASAAVEWYDIETRSEPCRHGVHTLPAIEHSRGPEELADLVDAAVTQLFQQRRFPVLLGGEHSITIGAIRAAARQFPKLSALQIDAHADTRESYHGSTHNHACVMARARELCPIVQVGIRAVDADEMETIDERRVLWAHQIVGNTDESWMRHATDLLTDDVYITIDLDAFDPSVIPATGTPEPGGLSWREMNRLLAEVTACRNVVGFDVVELLPQPGHHASAFTAAKLAYRLLSMAFASPRAESNAYASH